MKIYFYTLFVNVYLFLCCTTFHKERKILLALRLLFRSSWSLSEVPLPFSRQADQCCFVFYLKNKVNQSADISL